MNNPQPSTKENKTNFIQVGEMIACGHCKPDKYQVYDPCTCRCHTNENCNHRSGTNGVCDHCGISIDCFAPPEWLCNFRQMFVDENMWKNEDGSTAYVGIGNIEDFIRTTISKEKKAWEEETKRHYINWVLGQKGKDQKNAGKFWEWKQEAEAESLRYYD